MIGPPRYVLYRYGKSRLYRRPIPDLACLLTGVEHIVRRRADDRYDHVFTPRPAPAPPDVEIAQTWERGAHDR